MAKVFEKTRSLIGNDNKNEIFVAECDEVARFLNKEPRKALTMDFSISKSSERRIDFLLTQPTLQIEATNEISLPKRLESVSKVSKTGLFPPNTIPKVATPASEVSLNLNHR
ncbi:MAG: hypothetical protein H0W64_05130 [Gammaproteobacteria bacterium]|nr:hypothetical protein [Gammaproteobacteria bacterium]